MRRFGLAGVVAVSALLGLAACGGGAEEPAGAPATEAPAGMPALPAEPASDAAGATLSVAGLTGDAAAGARVFAQCRSCHTLQDGVNRVGPSLHGVIGRAAGTVPDYTYSPALKSSGTVWDEASLFAYLENPRGVMPGTKMSFAGVRDPQQRANLIAYLSAND